MKQIESRQEENWQRVIFTMRKHLDIWTHANIKPYWNRTKLSYMPILFNIGINGSTVAEISKRSMITKQNVSRTVKELEKHGMIVSELNENDRRSETLLLTDAGRKLVLDIYGDVFNLNEVYKGLVGKKNFETALEVLHKIIAYHESLNQNIEENLDD